MQVLFQIVAACIPTSLRYYDDFLQDGLSSQSIPGLLNGKISNKIHIIIVSLAHLQVAQIVLNTYLST